MEYLAGWRSPNFERSYWWCPLLVSWILLKTITKKFDLQYYDISGRLVFVRFLEELKTPFEIKWPLVPWLACWVLHGRFGPVHLLQRSKNGDKKRTSWNILARSTLHMCQIQFKWSKIHTLTLCMMCRRCSIVRCFLIEAADFPNLFQSWQHPHGVGFQLLYALCQPSGFLGFTILSATRKKKQKSQHCQLVWRVHLHKFFENWH